MGDQNDKTMMDQVALLSYIDDLIKARTDLNPTPEDLPKLKTFLLHEINNAINTHLVSKLSAEAQKELDALLDKKPTDEELNTFFTRYIPNLEAEIAVALLTFRATYLYPVTNKKQGQTPARKIMPAPLPDNKTELLAPSPAPVEKSEKELTVPVAPPAPAEK